MEENDVVGGNNGRVGGGGDGMVEAKLVVEAEVGGLKEEVGVERARAVDSELVEGGP